ncbi:uncharacterized protein LOC111803864 isoform X1 [Cucurbita pepo subsp. pepo]|uniref:uncharacterized protein LOC111803864 isoform X1 n=1 Tax=Cucurbita pepo subsp. pepo TaxID=3664 RepID=UPI000C9D878A|nr:uncharacterized protein LOC111803864 isoform X1 [Cucurbita pepo subsp. pepo]
MDFPALNTRPPTLRSLPFTRGLFHPDFARAIIYILVLLCAFFHHAACGPCFTSDLQPVSNEDNGHYMNDPAYGIHSTLPADISSGSNPTSRLSFESVCTDSCLFCFPSTVLEFSFNKKGIDVEASLVGGSSPPVGSTQDDKLAAYKSQSSDYGMFELFEGGIVSCSLNSGQDVSELSSIQKYDSTSKFDLSTCRGDHHCQKSPSSGQKKNLDVTNSDLSDSSISPLVDISPTELDWEHKFLYLPSLASLTVTNTCNRSVLHIYEPFSTDSQFYSCNFSEAVLGPGEAVSIYFVFYPKYLGLSSGHLILQTSFGGLLVPAKGFAIQSPYGIQPLLSLNIHSSGRWTKNLSLFNPYDDVLYVEELTGWISVLKEDKCYHTEVVCRVDRYQVFEEPKPSIVKEGLVVQLGHIGSPSLSMRPYKQWKIEPHSTEYIIEVDLSFEYGGTIIGTFWLQLLRPSQDKPDVVAVPLEAELEGGSTHADHKGSVFASFEPLLYHGNVFVAIALKNSASHLLSVLKIIEVAESKVFEFKSLEGLLLFPGTVSQVALITCNEQHADVDKASPEIFSMYSKCKLLMLTNESTSSHIEVPCKDIFLLCSEYWKYSFMEYGKQNEHFSSGNVRAGTLANHVQLQSEIKAVAGAEADELVLENWASMGTRRSMSVLDEHDVFFPMVEVGSHSTKWITVKNPSKWPVVMQLIINSGEIIDECKDLEEFIHLPSGSLIHNDSTMPKKYGFSLAEDAITEAYVHPYGDVLFGPILFYPSGRCHWRSSVLIRNNLSGVEWLSMRGYGGSSSLLLLEGSKPVISIDFELESPILLNISPSERSVHKEEISHACTLPLLKEFYAKNTGDLPLEFKKIKISGTECALDGFLVHNCKYFALEPGESKKLTISYQTDLSASVVYRDLELALATGILVIPMKASLPFYMLDNCRKSVLWTRLKKFSFAVLLISSVMFLLFCWIFPHMISLSSLDFLCKNEIKHLSSSTRSVEKACSVHHNEKRSQFSDVWSVFEGKGAPESSLQSKSLVIENSDAVEASQPNYLTVKTGKERGRRRKKKKGGGMNLAGLFEVSSSQSGNSTPSSPLSPTASGTPKRRWPMSPDVNQSIEASSLFDRVIDETHKAQTSKPTSVMSSPKPEVSVKNCIDSLVSSSKETPSESRKSCSKPILLPSATFPSAGRPAPNVICSPLAASASKIDLQARAPGSKLFNRKASLEGEGKSGIQDKYKYDIWGDHFSGLHLIKKSKDVLPMIPSAIEKDSDSFFETSPQTLIAKTQPTSVRSYYQYPQV